MKLNKTLLGNKTCDKPENRTTGSAYTFYMSFFSRIIKLSMFKLRNSEVRSHGQRFIEYILQIEEDKYRDFLNREYLRYEDLYGEKLPRLKKYDTIRNIYNAICINGFEFTHHDVISNRKHYKALQRRADRLLDLQGVDLKIFYYHHYCAETKMDMLIEDLAKLRNIYSERCPHVSIILFYQIIVKRTTERKLEHKVIDGIHIYEFHTLRGWRGNDKNLIWAYCDEDLVKQMMDDCRPRKLRFLINRVKYNA